MKNTQVSIIMRTKDRPVLLKRALASVASQTFTDYTLVIVNDGGDNEPVNKLIAELDSSVQEKILLVNTEGKTTREGVLHFGLDKHTAPYYAIHDDDDSWEPEFLQETTKFLDENPDYGGVATRCDAIIEEIDGDSVKELKRHVMAEKMHSFSLLETAVDNYCPPISQLLRRDVADKIGHWKKTLEVQADWDFNIRVLANRPFGFLPDKVLAHYHHRLSATGANANSILSENKEHREVNRQIREEYLRQAFQGKETYPGLGSLLAQGYYHREMLQSFTHVHDHITSAHDHLYEETHEAVERLKAMHIQIENLRNQIQVLAGMVETATEKISRQIEENKPLTTKISEAIDKKRNK